MTKRSMALHLRLEYVGIAILVLVIVVLPVLQSTTGDWSSPGWDIATYALLGAGILALVLLPWMRARPIRKLLDERLRESAEAFGLIGTLWEDNSGTSEVVALVASQNGVEVITPGTPARSLAWREIIEIKECYSTLKGPDMIAIVTAPDRESVRLVPMRESGMYKLPPFLIGDRVAKLRAMRKSEGDLIP